MNSSLLFPSLSPGTLGHLNLNEAGPAWLQKNSSRFGKVKANPLLDPDICSEMIADAHKEKKFDHSYGGYLEDRSGFLKDSHLEDGKKFLHLGVDFTVPAGTQVAATFNGRVVRVDSDFPEKQGWGTRVIIWDLQDNVYLIFAHLDRALLVKMNDRVKPGQHIGTIGKPPINGGWWPHLHLQALVPSAYSEALSKDFKELDGYGSPMEKEILKRQFPDPLQYIRLR